jgi:DNA-binding beta-propeller fold protein YncE
MLRLVLREKWLFLVLLCARFCGSNGVCAVSMGVTGEWDFTNGTLAATVGTDLQFVGDSGAVTGFLSTNIYGQQAEVMSAGAYSPGEGIVMTHGAQPNGGGQFVNQYTLIMDVMYPSSSDGQMRALFQTDPFNSPGNDAEFYIGGTTTLPSPDGLGAGSQFDSTLLPNRWYRIAFAVDLTLSNGQLTKYVNGARVATETLPGGIDGQYSLSPTVQLFTTGLGLGYTEPGFVRGIQFVNGCMTSNTIAALGGYIASGVQSLGSGMVISSLVLSASGATLNWSGGTGPFQVQVSTNLSGGTWQNAGSPTSAYTQTVPRQGRAAFYRVAGLPSQNNNNPGLTDPVPLSANPLPVMVDAPPMVVNPWATGTKVLPTSQTILPAGQRVIINGRPVDIARSPDGKRIFVKNINSMQVMDPVGWTVLQTINYPADGASMHGIAVGPDGTNVYVTGWINELYDFTQTNGVWGWSRTIPLPLYSDPCGVAISPDDSKAYVCEGLSNILAVISLTNGAMLQQINVGVAPWAVVLSPDGTRAYVSDWGGRHPETGDLTGMSAGTPVVVDSRGVGASGVVSIVDLTNDIETAEVPTGLHPSALALSADGSMLYVANANSDSVTSINTQTASAQETILVRPSASLPYSGSDPDGLALSADGTTLYVAIAGDNAIAVISLAPNPQTNSVVQGFIPTDWYPGALAADSNYLYVVNVNGMGMNPANVQTSLGSAGKVLIPSSQSLDKYTSQVQQNARVPAMLATQTPAVPGQAPVPVPVRVGEPSVFQHVVYIIKENKSYDYVLGDMTQGNGASNLCVFPQYVTPNHHALAAQYVLLDNYYCNGVLSADGHSWCDEAHVTDHIEKSFGGFARSYTLGTDALTYSSSGFIWNNVLSHGLTVRDYGEMQISGCQPGASWLQFYSNYVNHTQTYQIVNNSELTALSPYLCPSYPGWDLSIPDVFRADQFISDFNTAQSNGVWASLNVVYLPNDHTGGASAGYPTPQAMLADNDLALGRIVQAVTQSRFASNTCIFVIEDDPQNGPDHVDGHRSFCLVISPYTKRGQTIHTFYNQTGVVHTMEQMLGLPPMNQEDAQSALMVDCFTNTPNYTPYVALPNNVPLNTMNPGTTGAIMNRTERYWAQKSLRMNFSQPDLVNEGTLNRAIWHSVRGSARFPSQFEGPHGKGLARLGLKLDKNQKVDDD